MKSHLAGQGDVAGPPKGSIRPTAESKATLNSDGILVLGMHRSGTSALARVLGAMGAYIGEPDELLPAHPQDNPSGYWERAELVIAHDRVLNDSGYAWDRIAGFDTQRLDTQATTVLTQQIKGVIAGLRAGGRSWLVKDPRLCLLLPLWLAQAPNAACIVMVRDPREIAASLRESHRGVYTSHFLLALWEKYLRVLLTALHGRRALFVSYAQLLRDPEAQCARLFAGLREFGVSGLHKVAGDIAAFLDPSLRRSQPDRHVRLSSQQTALHTWLQSQADRPEPVQVCDVPQAEMPEPVLLEFQRAQEDWTQRGREQALGENQAQPQTLGAQLDAARHQRNLTALELTQSKQLAQEAQTQAKTLAAEKDKGLHQRNLTALELTRSKQLAQEAQAQLKALAAQRDDARHQLDRITIELTQSKATQVQAKALAAQMDDTRHQLDRTTIELTQSKQLAQATQVQAKALAAARDEARHQRNLTTMELDEVRHQRNITAIQLANSEHQAAELRAAVHALRASWSWKITAPLRGLGGLLRPRLPGGIEQKLYRAWYSIPGLSTARKRAIVLWVHHHASWLTRDTLSYRLAQQAQQLQTQRDASQFAAPQQRMDAERAGRLIAAMSAHPRISVVMPVYNVERRWLLAAVYSVRRQLYPHWQLCVADDASTRDETRQALDELERCGDPRITLVRLRKNSGIAVASNAALKLATGDYVGLLDHDDELASDALLEAAQVINASHPDVVYSDEDKLEADGRHVEPHFKPDFSLEYFLSINYLCHFAVIDRQLLQRIGGFRSGFDGAQDFDLLLRATEQGKRVEHIAKVLYHWRKIEASTASSSQAKPEAAGAGLRALAESLRRRGINATATAGPYPTTYRVRREIVGQPQVSIILPFRDKPELLATCVHSILRKTDYPYFEILGIDNGSSEAATHALMADLCAADPRVRFVRYDVPFNYSVINNFGARQARGEHLLFLNNDTEVIEPEWLRSMLEHSQRDEVGVVGAKLLYPDDRIQHGGVIVGIGGVAGHAHLLQPGDHPGYFARAQLPQELSAVTFACAMTRRCVFEQLGGLNERELTIAFNDIDYCLRVREAGKLVIYTPYAVLYHHESRTRGYEDNPEKQARFAREIAYMQQRHAAILQHGDPYYNPNLRLDTHDFSPRPGYIEALPL